ncbi:MAG: hypothetical protein K2X27_12620 [Candidatus Obscuribacterales bacterium]|nr:hypothetical protein [Candidatus Obscuribacterales bacterium]
MFAGKRQKSSAIGLLAVSIAISGFVSAAAYSPAPGAGNYVPISVEEVKKEARTDLNHAKAAGRLSADEAAKLSSALDNAYSLSSVEETWGDILAKAQEAKVKHPSIDHLVTTWTRRLDGLVKSNTILPSAVGPYKERLKAIERLKKQFYNNDKFYDFWEYIVLAIDLSSLNDRLERALVHNRITVEKLNELILRTDNYVARNQVCARALTTYKSFEIEPDHLQQTRQELYTVLKDKANSKLSTPAVKEQLFKRLLSTHYEACSTLPTEAEVDKAIAEVQRLLDSGARNGNLTADDGVRLQHELLLVKELKKSYPGPTPGVDLVERELRKEEVRFMSLDLRMMQDWLGRMLRKDGDTEEGREQVLRLVRRLDLASFSHRITDADVNTLASALDDAIRTAKSDTELSNKVKDLEGQLDMMVSDFSLQPADTSARLSDISSLVNKLKSDQSSASADKDRIQRMVSGMESADAAHKYGMSVVAASELEMVRNKVYPMLKAQGVAEAAKK